MAKFDRKVTKIGNSYGVTLPSEVLKEAGLAYGEDVQIEAKNGKIVLEKKVELNLPEGVDSEFMDMLNDIIKKHDKAFKGLVER